MKRSVIAAIALILGMTAVAASADNTATAPDQLVVDSSTRSKVLNEYTRLTRDAIQRAWKTPLSHNIPGAVKGRVRIDYTVKRSGELESVNLVRGSGNQTMDRSLVAAIRAAQPFPPFPDEISARRLLVRANFIVADLPSAPVVTVSQPVQSKEKDAKKDPEQGAQNPRWGLPAGTSEGAPAAVPAPEEPPPPAKKLRWGRDQ